MKLYYFLILIILFSGCTNIEENTESEIDLEKENELNIKQNTGEDFFVFEVIRDLDTNQIELDTIFHTGKLNLDFYRKNYFVPYYYPEKIVDTNYENDTIVVWNDSTNIGDFKLNWNHTLIYDSNSRIISYQYSGCFICSQLPYDYRFFYNEKNQLTEIINKINFYDKTKFGYSKNGNIINVKEYESVGLRKEIRLIEN